MTKNKSFLFSIKVGGINVNLFNIKNVISGVVDNCFFKNFEIHLFVEENVSKEVYNYLKKKVADNNIKKFYFKKLSWFQWLNHSFKSANNFDYLITLHDDTYIRTKNFDKIIINEIGTLENVGAFTFLDDGYLRRFFNPQLRGAYHIDRIYNDSRKKGIEYEYHNQKPYWYKKNVKIKKIFNLLNIEKTKKDTFEYQNNKIFNFASKFFFDFNNLDFPKKKIRAHSLWTNVMGFKSENLKLFQIVDLDVPHGIFADEDICMSTQMNDLINIFIPNVSYYHDRQIDISRSWRDIKSDYTKVSKIFHERWKFYPEKLENLTIKDRLSLIKFLENKYSNKLTWTKNYQSFEWIYI